MADTTYYTSCFRIERKDGVVICMTSLDKDLIINDTAIGLSGGDQTYLSAAGYTPTNMQSTSDNAVNNADVEGVLSAIGVQREDIIGGIYDFAKIHYFLWDWFNNTLVKKIGSGHWGEVTIKDNSYVAEFRSLSQQIQQKIGRTYNPECDEQLGGPRCTIDLTWMTDSYTVDTVTDNATFNTTIDLAAILDSGAVTTSGGNTTHFFDSSITEATGTFDGLYLKFTSGNNAGETHQIDTQVGTRIDLVTSASNIILVSDAYNIYNNIGGSISPTEVNLITAHVPTAVVSKTTFNDTTLTQADDFYNGDFLEFTSGPNVGQIRTITDYTLLTGEIILDSEVIYTITLTDEYRIYELQASTADKEVGLYEYGNVTFTSGNNNGLSQEVKRSYINTFELFLPMPFDIQAGDTFEVYAGCDKRLATCKDRFSNHINFQGFPFIPSQDAITKFGGQ